MMKFMGRLSLKPTKWGFKVWVMAESSTGCVYTGREGAQEKGLAHRVIMDLTRHYYGSDLSIFMDNTYTSVSSQMFFFIIIILLVHVSICYRG